MAGGEALIIVKFANHVIPRHFFHFEVNTKCWTNAGLMLAIIHVAGPPYLIHHYVAELLLLNSYMLWVYDH